MRRENIESIKIEFDEDIIFTTCGKYKYFLANGKQGLDGYMLWSHLMFTARIQQTAIVRANNSYLADGLCWSEKRVKAAKSFLTKAGMIEAVAKKNEKNVIIGWYIKLKIRKIDAHEEPEKIDPQGSKSTPLDSPQGCESTPVESHTGGSSGQMLKRTSKCLNEQVNGPQPPPADIPTSGEPPGSPPALTFETKTDLHNRLKYDFVTGSSKLDPGGEPYYHDGKEAGAINELIKRGIAGGKDLLQAYEAIRRKAMILYRKIESPTKTHFADMSFTPSILLAHWNNLKEERPVKPKSRFGASCTPEVMRKLMS